MKQTQQVLNYRGGNHPRNGQGEQELLVRGCCVALRTLTPLQQERLVAPLLEAKPNSFWRLSMASVLVLLKAPNLSDVLDSVLSNKRATRLARNASSFKADSRLRAKISVSLSLISSGSGCLRLRKKSVIMPAS